MPSGNSQAVAAVPASANVLVGRLRPVPAAGTPPREIRQEAESAGRLPAVGAGLGRGLRRVASVVGDIGGIVAFAYAVPVAILAIGIPVALLVRMAIWVVRAL